MNHIVFAYFTNVMIKKNDSKLNNLYKKQLEVLQAYEITPGH